jgi:hypothetical protein
VAESEEEEEQDGFARTGNGGARVPSSSEGSDGEQVASPASV